MRGSTDNFKDVVLLGNGMDNSSYGNVPMGISVWNAQNVTIADLSIGRVYDDPIEIKGDAGANAVTIYHDRLYDAGEQFIKVDPPSSGVGTSNSAVEYSLIEYTNGPPTTDHGGGVGYTNGIDIHDGQNWDIKSNLIRNLHTPDADSSNLWDPAILVWQHSSNVTTEGNTIINCDRAIAYGLIDQTSGYDNQGGIIRNNFIYQSPGLFSASRAAGSDGQIIIWDSPSTAVDQNTILTSGNSTNSIQARWTTTGAETKNNLADAPIGTRGGATFTASGNYLSATASMFVNPTTGDLHLVWNSATQANVIDQDPPLLNVTTDWDGNARPDVPGTNVDVGADEYSTTKIVPTVTSESPSPNSTGVANTTTLTATFNESVVVSSITTTSFVLKDSNNNTVTATVSYTDSNHTAALTPSSPLSASTKYTATISGVTDAAGNVMASPFSWSFTTAAAVAPTVTSETPASAATNVAVSTAPTATFNEAVQSSTVSFTLKNSSGSSVAGSVSYNSTTNVTTFTPTPTSALAYNTTYTATVSGAQSTSGVTMTAPFSWSFTTDAAPPSVTSKTPASGAKGVAVSTAPTAKFNKAVQASTISFTLKNSSGSSVAATVAYNSSNNTATLTPSAALAYSTTYTATVSGAKDSAGDPMTSAVSWSFTTAAAVAPIVTSETPASAATNVAVSTAPTATFNEAVQSSTMSFTLKNSSGSSVAGSVSYNSTTNVTTLTLTPTSALAYNTTYTATVSGAESTSGVTMTAPFSWSFTTVAAVTPTVTSETPATSATGVATNSNVTATFNESVQASSITTSTFVLKGSSSSSVTATVAYNSSTNTATLTPSSLLANSTTYTATISGVTDTAGQTMANPFSWSFTTGPAPAVTTCSPAWSATGVAVSSLVTATFNEAVQSGTIGFTLTNPSGSTVAATVAYNSSTNTATLTPSAALAFSTKYTATVSGAKDTAGDPMTSPDTWTFTTAATGTASTEPLLYQSNLQYVGAFRVPDGTIGASSFSYGGTAITYNPANNSLFAVGMPYQQAVAEIAIPSSIVNSTNLNNLPVATVLQPFTSILPRIPNNPSSVTSGGGYEAIGGLMVDNGQLIGTAFNTYDASGSAMVSHFELSSLNLASASVSGLYQVGTMGGGFVGGYMTPVPSEWQSALGAPFLTGQGRSTSSPGRHLGLTRSASTPPTSIRESPRIYPTSITTRTTRPWAAWNSSPPTLFNSTVGGDNNTGFGAVFVPGSRSVLFFSAIGTGPFSYGLASDANDPNRTAKGPHSVGGNYTWQVWAYDANDFAAVKNGQKNPWDVVPYATWNFTLPTTDGAKNIGGVAFDPSSGRLYVSELNVDNSRSQYDSDPLIQVFQISLGSSPAASQQITQTPGGTSGVGAKLSPQRPW